MEIRKENGKPKKKYSLIPQHNRIPIEERNTTRRSRSKSPIPQREEAVKPTGATPKEHYVKTTHTRKTPPKSPSHKSKEVEVVEVINHSTKPSTSTTKKCQECLKWNNWVAQSLHYQEVTRNEGKKIIKSLTEENQN